MENLRKSHIESNPSVRSKSDNIAAIGDKAAPSSADSCAVIIGANVKRLRERSKITKTRFAQMLGIGRPLLNKIENGMANPRINLICQMAEALEVEPWELLMPPDETQSVHA